MSETRAPLVNGGVAIALLTAGLYCISTANYGGFMGVLKLDADVLDRNFHQTLYHGFLTAFVPAFRLLAVIALTLFASVMIGTPAVNAFLRKRWSRRRTFVRLRREMALDQRSTPFELTQRRLAGHALICLAVAIAVIGALAHFDGLGKKSAEKLLAKLDQPIQDSTLVTVRIDGQPHRLLYLICGARNCAGIDPKTHMVHYFPQHGHAFQHPKALSAFTPVASDGDARAQPSQASPNRSALERSQ